MSRLEAAHCLRLLFTTDIVGVVIITIIVVVRVLMTLSESTIGVAIRNGKN